MRSQRYQRAISKSAAPARVDDSTYQQDAKFLNIQIQALKNIWDDEEEEPEVKKGNKHNAIAQDVADLQRNWANWSVDEKDLTPEELEARRAKLGGDEYIDRLEAFKKDKSSKAPLKTVLDGGQIEIASIIEDQLKAKYGEAEYFNFIAYADKNQPVIDKGARFNQLMNNIPSSSYTEDYWAERGITPTDYISETQFKEKNVEKYFNKAEAYVRGIKLTPETVKPLREKVFGRIDKANLPDDKKNKLKSIFVGEVTRLEKQMEDARKKASEELKSDYLNGKISTIKNYSTLVDNDATKVARVKFERNTQALDDGRLTWNAFTRLPSDRRFRDVYQEGIDQKVKQEFAAIRSHSKDVNDVLALKAPNGIAADQSFMVELTYNYFNEQKASNPEYSLDDARRALFSERNIIPHGQSINPHKLLVDSSTKLEELGLSKAEYLNLFKTEEGRRKIIDIGVRKGIPSLNFSYTNYEMEDDYVRTRPRGERPATN